MKLEINWQWIAVSVGAVFAMWLGGLVSGFWAALGIVGFLLVLGLLQTLPGYRGFASAVFIVWVAVSFVLPMFAASFRADWPILSEAMRRRSIDVELKAAEWKNPTALRARIGVARYCRELDRMQGEWVAQRLERLRRSV